MRIVDIPPYRRAGVNYSPAEGYFMMRESIAPLREKGQLESVEIDIDEGEQTEYGAQTRDDEVVTNIAVGVIERVKAVCATGEYDAIVTQAGALILARESSCQGHFCRPATDPGGK